jgi:hypothetical protein
MSDSNIVAENGQQRKTLLDIALTRFNDFDGWLRDDEQIWTFKNCTAWMKNAGGFCVIQMRTDPVASDRLTARRYSQELTVGVYDPRKGWLPSTQLATSYPTWISETKRRLFQ